MQNITEVLIDDPENFNTKDYLLRRWCYGYLNPVPLSATEGAFVDEIDSKMVNMAEGAYYIFPNSKTHSEDPNVQETYSTFLDVEDYLERGYDSFDLES